MNQHTSIEAMLRAQAQARRAKWFPAQPVKKALTIAEVNAAKKEREALQKAIDRAKREEELAEARRIARNEKRIIAEAARLQRQKDVRAVRLIDRLKIGKAFILSYCAERGVSYEQMVKAGEAFSKDVDTLDERQHLVHAIRTELKLPYEQIGMLMGDRVHSTIRNAHRKYLKRMKGQSLETKTAGDIERGTTPVREGPGFSQGHGGDWYSGC